ncbi:MAG: hypothetical protein LBJ48_06340, partial [Coriobacteriales bacterium]|nr:hypothetical protein [Coriobacteriales bacterium]
MQASGKAASMNGATALLRALEDLGVTQVFGLPGVQNIEVYDALLASGIHHVLARHEQAAVHMADGYARATGEVGVVFATSGPGATNTVTGIATAYMDSVPVVVITGQVPTASIGTDAFQEADITTITLPITKHSYLIKEVGELVPSVFEAFYLAISGRPGPVLIDLPGDVAAAPVCYTRPVSPPVIPSYRPTIKGNARQIKAAAELLLGAQRPVLLVGGGVVSSSASPELIRLAEQQRVSVATTLLAKGAIPASHPLFLGQPGVYGAPRANAALQEADVLVAVGTRFSERVTAEAEGFAPRARIIHIDIDPAEIGKNIRVDVPIVGDAATVLAALSEKLEAAGGRATLSEAAGEYAAGGKTVQGEATPDGIAAGGVAENAAVGDGVLDVPPHNPSPGTDAFVENATKRCFASLGALLQERDDVIITTDVGQHQLWASHLLDVNGPRRFLTSGGLGTMGFGLPAALGAQVASPESLVLCVSGDGSFQMNLQEMATAAVQQLPVKVVVFNNHSHGLVRQWQELFLDQRYSHTLLSDTPDYVALAAAYGWEGRRVDLTEWDAREGANTGDGAGDWDTGGGAMDPPQESQNTGDGATDWDSGDGAIVPPQESCGMVRQEGAV